jgi:hypothetical protein
MKNPPDKLLQRRRLVLRREIITELNRPQLGKVVGGIDCTYFSGCHPTLTGCVE